MGIGSKMKAKRLSDANILIQQIAMFGRRFFYSEKYDRIARFELTIDGKLWFRDEDTDKRVYVAYKGRWKNFTSGGTMRRLIEGLALYIRTGKRIPASYLGPWPSYMSDGDLWGYGKDTMEALRNAVSSCDCLDWQRKSAVT